MDYQSARPYVRGIRQRVADRTMPVWKPMPGIGDFLNPQILTPNEIDTITRRLCITFFYIHICICAAGNGNSQNKGDLQLVPGGLDL